MKKNDLRNALSGINKEYISESDDFMAVSTDFRKYKNRKKRIIASTLCIMFVCIGAIGTAKSGLLKSMPVKTGGKIEGAEEAGSGDYSVACFPADRVIDDVDTAKCVAITEEEAKNLPDFGDYLPSDIPSGYHWDLAGLYETTMKDGNVYRMLKITYRSGKVIKVTDGVNSYAAIDSSDCGSDFFVTLYNYKPDNTSIVDSGAINAKQLSEKYDEGIFFIKYDDCYIGIETLSLTANETLSLINSIGNSGQSMITELYYSDLVKNTDAPELDGYDTSSLADVVAFEEAMLNDSIGVIEGEILDVYVNNYEYETASDKFESNGRIYHKPQTVAYKIKVNRVLSGDFSIGDVVTVEDHYYVLESILSIRKGATYVIPIGKGDGKIYETDEIVSGDTSLESCYYTLYQFHPQIEKVDGGYIVPIDWKTLITEDCTAIIMDIDENGFPFSDSLYYVPDSVFNERIDLIIHS